MPIITLNDYETRPQRNKPPKKKVAVKKKIPQNPKVAKKNKSNKTLF